MTVSDLIKELSTKNQNATVVANVYVENLSLDGFVKDVRDISAETDGPTVMIFATRD